MALESYYDVVIQNKPFQEHKNYLGSHLRIRKLKNRILQVLDTLRHFK